MSPIKILLSLLLFSLSSTGISFSDENLKSEAMEKVRNVLKDPESANFKDIKIIKNSKNEESVCGEVNAKNSFGGYVGYETFAYTNQSVIMEKDSNYKLSGCDGVNSEFEERLKLEAEFNCEVLFNLLKNVITKKETKETALETAMTLVKKRAHLNGNDFSDDTEKGIRTEFTNSLEKTSADKKAIKQIKSIAGYSYSEYQFRRPCVEETLNQLKTLLKH